MKITSKNLAIIGGIISTAMPLFPASGAHVNKPQNRDVCRACERTSRLALKATLTESSAELLDDLAKASTLPSRAEYAPAVREAKKANRQRRQEAWEQFEARIAICEMLEECRYNPAIDPANFLTPEEAAASPHPYFPLIPGRIYNFQSQTEDGLQTTRVHVTDTTRVIFGVTCIEVRDTVSIEGEFVEDTLDWYALDKQGNLWYFGELAVNYADGLISDIGGSWEAGVNGAKAGIIMKAAPEVGDAYRQEFLINEAEDSARFASLNETVTVQYGTFTNCWKTEEFTPLEPETVGEPPCKFYALGIGFVLETKPDGEREELVSIEIE